MGELGQGPRGFVLGQTLRLDCWGRTNREAEAGGRAANDSGRRRQERGTPGASTAVMSSGPQASALIVQRRIRKPGDVRDLLSPLGPRASLGAPAVCRAPPRPGRETAKLDPVAEPQDQDHCQETQAKGGGPNLWGCEFPTFSPSSSAPFHLCPEGKGVTQGPEVELSRDLQLEGISGWLSGHLQPCLALSCPYVCMNNLGSPAPQKVGALTIFLQVRRQSSLPQLHS